MLDDDPQEALKVTLFYFYPSMHTTEVKLGVYNE